ncbi:MAG TPA: ATP-binding cassette domain-containing protein [Phycicoccus sp.]|jgi:ABC-2 type transport system ATP-binding protein|nr:ATP-binding cassette domain-containing protein [Phycicoccus sp.]HQH06203.1 ATP-binding cassette domain-containing protein [Phycicoccus sp.]HQK30260.1 ATP-binding cassette domain-containing protein [Phycicoccus sp.]
MIEARELTKKYGDKVAVDRLSFTVRPGIVTGFLGPNGAGKSTTMRLILGLDRPTSGSVTIDGKPYAAHREPLKVAGALLEARAVHTSRSAYNHLLALATTHGISRSRVDEVIDFVGLDGVARKRAGAFSLGMGQRLGIASAILADPTNLLLDEPVNGLDPEGILWIRSLLKELAAQGRTVFVSSHLMSEMALTAEHVIVVGRGRLMADTSMADLIATSSSGAVLVTTPQADALATALTAPGIEIVRRTLEQLEVHGATAPEVGAVAARIGAILHELTAQQASLEQAFMDMTKDEVEYHGQDLSTKDTNDPNNTTDTNRSAA